MIVNISKYFMGHEAETASKAFLKARERALTRAQEHGVSRGDMVPIEYILGAIIELILEDKQQNDRH